MFSPVELDLERGWPGRIDGDRVIQLAAQTLQSYFTGGGGAREHAEYPLAGVVLRAPVLHPPSVRIFGPGNADFRFANPAAIVGPGDVVRLPVGVDEIVPVPRVAAVIGAGGEVGGYTLMIDWLAPSLAGAKAHDFAISLGPIVVTPDEAGTLISPGTVELAAQNTRLVPGDVIATGEIERERHPVAEGATVEYTHRRLFGTLQNTVSR